MKCPLWGINIAVVDSAFTEGLLWSDTCIPKILGFLTCVLEIGLFGVFSLTVQVSAGV